MLDHKPVNPYVAKSIDTIEGYTTYTYMLNVSRHFKKCSSHPLKSHIPASFNLVLGMGRLRVIFSRYLLFFIL